MTQPYRKKTRLWLPPCSALLTSEAGVGAHTPTPSRFRLVPLIFFEHSTQRGKRASELTWLLL